jgi:hypothetical protein
MIKQIAVLAGLASLAIVPAAPAKHTDWQHCASITKRVKYLSAKNVSCTYAGYFSKGFKLGVLYAGSPYKGSYRGFTCAMSTQPGLRYVRCNRLLRGEKQVISFDEIIPNNPGG